MRRYRSIKLNMILNAIKGLMGVLFPLITFPYISNVLGVENIGKYNFSSSVIGYFSMLAALGIGSYAIREGARIREDMESLNKLANQMFSINVVSTAITYALFVLLLLIVPKFRNYIGLLWILSLVVIFNTMGIEWIYSIYEDYMYITVRSIFFQILSFVLLFLFVKTSADLYVYAGITVISRAGANVLNFFHARKYCKVRFTFHMDMKRHIMPILLLFAMSATVTIYVNSDMVILGFLCNDFTVGIYSVSTKIYGVVKTVVSSVVVVSIPRISSMLGDNDKKNELETTVSDIYGTMMTAAIPIMVGLILLRKEIVLFISGEDYIEAESSLFLLAIAMLCCMGAFFWGQCILIPLKKEKLLCYVTIVSAVTNIMLNFILIPFWKENAAALTTIIAEAITFVWCRQIGKKYIAPKGMGGINIKIMIGCAGIVAVYVCLSHLLEHGNIFMCLTIVGSVVIYGVLELALKNPVVIQIFKKVLKRC